MQLLTNARIKLTLWYVLILMSISCMFSLVIYAGVTRNIEASFTRTQNRIKTLTPNSRRTLVTPSDSFDSLFIDEIKATKRFVLLNLLLANGFIAAAATIASYVLAGKSLQPVEKVLKEQQRFVANASHELRTPLTSLKTTIEVSLREKDLPLKYQNSLRRNLEDVDALNLLIDKLLQLASFENRNDQFTTCNIDELLSKAIQTMKPLANEKSIQITSKIQHQQIKANESAIMELIYILLDNAIKYSQYGSEVYVGNTKTSNYVTLKVRDAGIGIPKKDLPHIFNRFYQVDSARTHSKKSGFGLGLSVAKQIVTNHNGKIIVQSQVGVGTTVVVKLPISHS